VLSRKSYHIFSQEKLSTKYLQIEKIIYTEPTEKQNGRVYINETQYIDNVPSEIYNFYIGGYQVCHKWLKDRKDREFTDDDFEHYSQIVAIIKRTIALATTIDQVLENYGGFAFILQTEIEDK
jgi:hypothetical protein